MAKSINLVVLSGRLGRDAETAFTPSGVAVTKFSIATDRRVKKGDEWISETDWHNVVAFKAEWASNYLTKGSQVTVTGRLQTRKYEKDGETRYSTEVICDEIVPGGGSQRSSEEQPVSRPRGGGGAPAQRTQQAAFDPSDDVPFAYPAPLDSLI